MMSAIANKEHLARLPPKPGSQLKKDGRSHLPGSITLSLNIKVLCDNYYYQANKLKLCQ